MGGSFNFITMNGDESKESVIEHFKLMAEDDLYENGHSYSGGWGMFPGLIFKDQVFDNVDLAEDAIMENQCKWDPALCVKFKNEDGKIHWALGGWASS